MFSFLYEIQLAIRGSFTHAIDGFARSGDWSLLIAMMPLGIVFGAAHAMTPGHSKSILASYVLGSGLSPWRAVVTSLVLAATHICSAVLLAVVANSLVTRTLVGAGRAPALENMSRYMLVAIGVWLVWRAWHARPHIHGEGYFTGFVAGLVPCPLTLFVMMLAVSRGVPEAGLSFALAMFLGVGGVLVAIAAAVAFARGWAEDWIGRHGARLSLASRWLETVAGLALITIAVLELTRR
jgi:ABC-type nickel/cobalt efflux system permease component RcnA